MSVHRFLFSILLALQPVSAIGASAITEDLWAKHSVEVCWANAKTAKSACFDEENKSRLRDAKITTPPQIFRERVRERVNQEFSIRRTGISFRGWRDCNQTSTADVILYFNYVEDGAENFANGVSAIGDCSPRHGIKRTGLAGVLLEVSKDLASDTNVSNVELSLLPLVLHEFGHLAGLLHEDPDSYTCDDPRTGYKCKARTNRDFFSMMSYAHYLHLWSQFSLIRGRWVSNPIDLNSPFSAGDAFTAPAISRTPDGARLEFKARLSTKDVQSLRCTYLPAVTADCL